jgi:hypothetical protein
MIYPFKDMIVVENPDVGWYSYQKKAPPQAFQANYNIHALPTRVWRGMFP